MRSLVCKRLKLEDKAIKMWNYWGKEKNDELSDDAKTLYDYGLEPGHEILVESSTTKTTAGDLSPGKVSNYKTIGTTPPGTTGLVNMGNTCFMNSGLQCLIHSDLKEYFLSNRCKLIDNWF
jgi:uncharacterized UBP type Zn finger protein